MPEEAKMPPFPDPTELWRQWYDATAKAWSGLLDGSKESGRLFPMDPFTFFKQWYDAASEAWSKATGDVIGSEKFVEAASQFLESYASFYKAFRRANEEYFRNLQLPTRSDIARVAELVIALEEKVDQVEDAFENYEEKYAQPATAMAESLASVEQRLDTVEQRLENLPAALQDAGSLGELQERLGRVESKLDSLLATLERRETREQEQPAPATTGAGRQARRRAPKPEKGE